MITRLDGRAREDRRPNPDSREQRILGIIETARSKRGRFREDRITMAHGAGGKATQSLIEGLLAPAFGIDELTDAGAVDGDLALTTDTFVVRPLRFPGGSIGELAVNGTVNDLAMAGARPLALSLALVLEEGLSADDLRAEVEAIATAAATAGVAVITGDTKVVERGKRRRDVRLHHRRRAPRPARAAVAAGRAAGRPHPRVGRDRRARHGDHARARRPRPRRRRALGHALAVAGGRRDPRARTCTACATPRAAASPRC